MGIVSAVILGLNFQTVNVQKATLEQDAHNLLQMVNV